MTQVVNGSHVVTDVTVGAAENGETQITSGVKAGDKVLERWSASRRPGGGSRRPLRRRHDADASGGGAGGFGGFGGAGGGFTGAGGTVSGGGAGG